MCFQVVNHRWPSRPLRINLTFICIVFYTVKLERMYCSENSAIIIVWKKMCCKIKLSGRIYVLNKFVHIDSEAVCTQKRQNWRKCRLRTSNKNNNSEPRHFGKIFFLQK
jgi:hypothetical protein